MSGSGFVELQNAESLERFLELTRETPAILFKHSNTCGISSQAYREMLRVKQPVGIVIVQDAREVSDEIERRFGIQHQTPQALIVLGDKLLWDASHSRVRAHIVEDAFGAVSGRGKR
ncbi:MAG TPA: bacillithiol system redox-active protein YtxJ [Pyrinomonadaceae bacterium]|jgi:bacillithiol system protein YtxJ